MTSCESSEYIEIDGNETVRILEGCEVFCDHGIPTVMVSRRVVRLIASLKRCGTCKCWHYSKYHERPVCVVDKKRHSRTDTCDEWEMDE